MLEFEKSGVGKELTKPRLRELILAEIAHYHRGGKRKSRIGLPSVSLPRVHGALQQ